MKSNVIPFPQFNPFEQAARIAPPPSFEMFPVHPAVLQTEALSPVLIMDLLLLSNSRTIEELILKTFHRPGLTRLESADSQYAGWPTIRLLN